MKKIAVLFILVSVFYGCKGKKNNVADNGKHLIGSWELYVSEADLQRMKKGRQKMFIEFKKQGKGIFYYYNIDYRTGTEYNRKDQYFKYTVQGNKIKIKWLKGSIVEKVDIWPFSLHKKNKMLAITDSSREQTMIFNKVTD